MRIPRIYIDAELTENIQIEAPDNIAHYLGKVLRMEPGRELILFNGQGGEYQANIVEFQKKSALLSINNFSAGDTESPLHTHLAIGISRGDRWEFVLQKATELGISHITPLFTSRSEVKISSDKIEKKIAHWQGILVSACEQSRRAVIPTLDKPMTLMEFLNQDLEGLKLVLHHRGNARLNQYSPINQKCILLVGPEGGLDDTEIMSSQNKGFDPLTLGPRVLRTETAPLVALTAVQLTWGDL